MPSLGIILPLLCVMIVAAAIVPSRFGGPKIVHRPNVYIVDSVGKYGYHVLWSDDDYREPHYILICNNLGFEPPFDGEETAKWFHYRDEGVCWDMSKIPSYDMLRDKSGELILMDEKEFRAWLQTEKATRTQ